MSEDRYKIGMELLTKVDGEIGKTVLNSLKEIAPDLSKYLIEFAFGDIYGRKGLDPVQKELITLASLTTQGGCELELTVHINASLNIGLAPKQIVDAIIHCLPYTGFPRVLNSINVAKKVFESRSLKVEG